LGVGVWKGRGGGGGGFGSADRKKGGVSIHTNLAVVFDTQDQASQ
jgi:hypothetical protein